MGVTPSRLKVTEVDGSPSIFPYALKFPNGTVTDNGDGTATYTPAATTPTPKSIWATVFETTTRFEGYTGGTGSKSFGTTGALMQTGATAGSYSAYRTYTQGQNANAELGSPLFSCIAQATGLTGTDFECFMGMGDAVTPSTAAATVWLEKHFGFRFERVSSGTKSLYASQANGTTETKSAALATIVSGDTFELIVQVNSGTSADYYFRQNYGALSAATNLATNMPTTMNDTVGFATNNIAAAAVTLCVSSASVQR